MSNAHATDIMAMAEAMYEGCREQLAAQHPAPPWAEADRADVEASIRCVLEAQSMHDQVLATAKARARLAQLKAVQAR